MGTLVPRFSVGCSFQKDGGLRRRPERAIEIGSRQGWHRAVVISAY